jgi:hypothetical protein
MDSFKHRIPTQSVKSVAKVDLHKNVIIGHVVDEPARCVGSSFGPTLDTDPEL